MAKSVQYRDADTLMDAYKDSECSAWAVVYGKEMLRKGTDSTKLQSYIESLEDSTPIIYTLRGYYEITDAKEIKEKTEADFSGNFLLNGDPGQITTASYAETNHKNRLFQRLEVIEQSLTELKEDKEPEENQDNSLLGKLSGMIKTPNDLRDIIGVVKSIFSPGGQIALGAIGSFNADTMIQTQPQSTIKQAPDPAKIQRAQIAINTLEKNDPLLVEHLEKLAKLSVERPGDFKGLLTLLDSMK